MNLARGFTSALNIFLRLLLIDLWKLLFQIVLWILATWRRLRITKRHDEFDKKSRSNVDCVPMSHPAFKVPDPLIYSQDYLMRLGRAVTWDNPDIVLRKNNSDVSSSDLEPDTEYEIVARIWNNSTEAPVVDLPVYFSYLAFGIGTQSFPIADTKQPVFVTLGVKGGPNHPAFAVAKWTTPKAPGHYCIQVKLDPVSDANYGNNLGQENTLVGIAHSPAEFQFLLRNNARRQTAIHFEADTYVLPSTPACGRRGRLRSDPRTHSRAQYPVPLGWLVSINPPSPVLEPDEERSIAVTITPPDDFVGREAFNINAFAPWGFLGGVTLQVDVK